MTFVNVHLQSQHELRASNSELPRLRWRTNDPAREYAERPGEVEKLPDSVAALILCKQGFSKVGRNGISIDLDGKRLTYWSESSITIATKTGTNEKVLWTVNRHQPDVLHILTADGKYVETIPLDGKVPWFDEHATKRELGAKRRAQERSMQRVRMLHAPDSQAESERVDHNTDQITGLVQTFPARPQASSNGRPKRIVTEQPIVRENLSRAESAGRETAVSANIGADGYGSTRDSFSAADRLHRVQRNIDGQRTAHAIAQRAEAKRIAEVTEDDLDALTDDGDPDRTGIPVTTATENEDLSDLIL